MGRAIDAGEIRAVAMQEEWVAATQSRASGKTVRLVYDRDCPSHTFPPVPSIERSVPIVFIAPIEFADAVPSLKPTASFQFVDAVTPIQSAASFWLVDTVPPIESSEFFERFRNREKLPGRLIFFSQLRARTNLLLQTKYKCEAIGARWNHERSKANCSYEAGQTDQSPRADYTDDTTSADFRAHHCHPSRAE